MTRNHVLLVDVFLSSPVAPRPPAGLASRLLAPRCYTTEIDKAARTCLDLERPAFEAMLAEMEADYNRDHFDRQAPLDRLQALSPGEKQA
jgi:magnesium-protoporphyrin IX monomethyl ester (oxidative) cyclase